MNSDMLIRGTEDRPPPPPPPSLSLSLSLSFFFLSGSATGTCKFGNFLEFYFALKVNINLQNMSIASRLGKFDQKTCIFVVCCVQLISQHHYIFYICMHVTITELHNYQGFI